MTHGMRTRTDVDARTDDDAHNGNTRRRGLGGSLKLTTRKSISCGIIISPPAEEYFGERNVSCWDFDSNCYFSPFLLSYCYEWFLKQKPTKGCISHRLHQPQAKSVKAASATGCISHRLHQPQPSWRQCSCSLCTAKYFEYLDGVALDDLNSRDEKPLVSSWRSNSTTRTYLFSTFNKLNH